MKNQIIVIGDVHGRNNWKDIVQKHPGCSYVFLGDYNDPMEWRIKDNEVLRNFKEIIDFKLYNPSDVILLLGNHDIHYLYKERAVGSRYNPTLAPELSSLFHEYRECFQFAYQLNDILFTHAGLTEEWFTQDFGGGDRSHIAELLNQATEESLDALFQCGKERGGEDQHSGIFWTDTKEFEHPLQGFVQIVGHNRTLRIEQQWERTQPNTGIVFCDCLLHGGYLIIDPSLEGRARFFIRKL